MYTLYLHNVRYFSRHSISDFGCTSGRQHLALAVVITIHRKCSISGDELENIRRRWYTMRRRETPRIISASNFFRRRRQKQFVFFTLSMLSLSERYYYYKSLSMPSFDPIFNHRSVQITKYNRECY